MRRRIDFPVDTLSAPERLPELVELERLIDKGQPALEARRLCEVDAGAARLPVYALTLGNPDPAAPAAAFCAGVHGLERIGSQVILVFLHGLLERLRWDGVLQRQLERMRLVFIPIVNPGGMWRATRSNLNGVDLMRNAPVEARGRVPFPVGGHRCSPRLPWYRGRDGAPMEAEADALCRAVETELSGRPLSLVLDCHSGFGARDRIWFPYARSAEPIHHLPELHALTALFEQAYPNHSYIFEPQSRHYLAHGDLWDYLYERATAGVFLPLTLEMGSWLWIRKRPRQLFTRHGIFNPLAAHRLRRVLRQHLVWLEFLCRAACSFDRWLPQAAERGQHQRMALARWYAGSSL